VTVDQSSFDLAVRRRTQLTAAIVLAVLACAFALAALIGGTLSAVIVVIGTILTGAATRDESAELAWCHRGVVGERGPRPSFTGSSSEAFCRRSRCSSSASVSRSPWPFRP